MSEATTETGRPEFKTWPYESFGQVLKVSASLEPDVFPYKVSLPKDSQFFRNAYEGVYKGNMTTVFGSEKGKHPIANGIMVEHTAILAANDLGEIMVSRSVFEGNFVESLTSYSYKKMHEYRQFAEGITLPAGWRRFGDIHSHPVADVINSVVLPFSKEPKVNNVGVTWSGADFKGFVQTIRERDMNCTVMAVITPLQIGFMVATKKAIDVLMRRDEETRKLLRTTLSELPPYNNFEKLGIVLYAGNHSKSDKNILLQRLIY